MGIPHDLGKKGEQLAAKFLIQKGYRILNRNYRYLKAEVDIIAKAEEILVFVEVKTRRGGSLVSLRERIGKKKIQLLVQAADHYVTTQKLDLEVRFDIIEIYRDGEALRIEHLENAFYHF